MPCMSSTPEEDRRAVVAELHRVTALLCEACRCLEENNLRSAMSAGLLAWHEKHRQEDAAREREAEHRRRVAERRAQALSKLSLADRRALGLQED